jgi:hypothetical protein
MNANFTDMPNYFNKEELDRLKILHGTTMDKIILETYPKKEFRNWKTKISRLINKKGNDPSNYGFLELSEMLANSFNKRSILKEKLSPTHFIGKKTLIPCCGELEPDGTVRIFEDENIWKVKVDAKYDKLSAVYIRSGAFGGGIRLFKRHDKFIEPGAEHKFSLVRQKKTNIIYWGFLKPLTTPRRYSVIDCSMVTGAKVSDIATNIEIVAATPFIHAFKPDNTDWVQPK